MAVRPPSPPSVPKSGPVTTPSAEARIMFAILDKDANTWLEGVEGEYVAIADRRDGTSRVSDYGGLFRHVGKLSGDATAVSMAQYERFVATFDKDRDGTLNAVEWARYAAFLMEHRSLTFGANG